VRGGRFLIRCCAGDDLWLVCRYSPSPSDCLNFKFLNLFSSVGNHVLFEYFYGLSTYSRESVRRFREDSGLFKFDFVPSFQMMQSYC
jgi:hypothetical protein